MFCAAQQKLPASMHCSTTSLHYLYIHIENTKHKKCKHNKKCKDKSTRNRKHKSTKKHQLERRNSTSSATSPQQKTQRTQSVTTVFFFSFSLSKRMVETVTPGDCRGQVIYRVFIDPKLRGWEGRKTNQIAPPKWVGALHWQKTKVKLFIAFSLVHSYEAGQIPRSIRLTPRNEWGLSIGRKQKYTDLIDLANVDGIGWDGIGWDRTPFWGFQDLPLHTTTVMSNYEYWVLKFEKLTLLTVDLLLLFWKVFT